MQKMTDPVLPGSFPFHHWLVSKVERVAWLKWLLMLGVLFMIADIALECHTGIAETNFSGTLNSAVRANDAASFNRIISFQVFQAIGLLLVTWALHAASRSVAHYDIFAPGQEFKSLDGEGKS